ncbi:MAG: sulfite exporter TauE/SafE family protein, partial [Halobacteria archaeon]|nr:sulfite exporter TauE/SafE family protein [Halobacteria archaeon]
GAFLIYPGVKMVLDTDVGGMSTVKEADNRLVSAGVFVFGALVGFSSGLFGIGGGSLMVPVLTLVMGLTITRAVATSLFAMFPSAVVASYKQFDQGNLFPELAFPLILGIVIGASFGPYISGNIPKKTLRKGFGILLLIIAARMLMRGIV